MQKVGFLYITASRTGSTLYVGVAHDLMKRLSQHRTGTGGSRFARRYNVDRLVYFEPYDDIQLAIGREKQLKGWKRSRKEDLIRKINPLFRDLTEEAARIQTELFLKIGILP